MTQQNPSDRREVPQSTEASLEHIARMVRAYRKARRMTQRGLAAETGVTPGLISHIETGRTRPSTSTLLDIVRVLDLPLDELFTKANTIGDTIRPAVSSERSRDVVRGGQQQTIRLENGVTWQLLTSTADRRLRFLLVTYEPGGASSEAGHLVHHDDQEYFYIIVGSLTVWLGDEEMTLSAGDAINFDSTIPHRFENRGDVPCIGVWAILPPDSATPDMTTLVDQRRSH